MTGPRKRSTAKAGIEPRSAASEANAFTTRPTRQAVRLRAVRGRVPVKVGFPQTPLFFSFFFFFGGGGRGVAGS